ncbi:MAG: Gfo/Idh/MocA family oxidoreductase [Candidatus Hydrogenedentes bacterium]|nr:Gfo/Idh/MocA family oxidoreductase [Candidatus Hydrogenedentota bacterium]
MTRNTRRGFLRQMSLGAGIAGIGGSAFGAENTIQGFDETDTTARTDAVWQPISDRKVRVGIVGYGVCRFGAAFSFQDHPNVEVAAVSDLFPDRCAALAKACRCDKTYPSLEEMVKDDTLEAIFLATDAPSHARHAILALEHGKHVACAVPATWGSLEEGQQLYDTVKKTGLKYMMFETSVYRDDCYAMRTLYNAGKLGRIVYSEGEYYHYVATPIDSYKGWRIGGPPLWYPTHSTAYHVGVCGEHYTEVSCMAIPSTRPDLVDGKNAYNNPFGTEVGLFRASGGGMSRMLMSKDSPGYHGEVGRVRGDKGSVTGTRYEGIEDIGGIELAKPPLPPDVKAGGHGGSHGYLTEEFITAILQDRAPLVDVSWSLNMTVCGIVAHESAMKGGELLKIPYFAPLA